MAPLQPWALGLYQHRQQRHLRDDPTYRELQAAGRRALVCNPTYGVQFVEDRERQRIFVLIGGGNRNYRIIYLDGREHRGPGARRRRQPALLRPRQSARWEGDTLVVETTGFNEDFWFTNGGLPHTKQLSLIERFSRPNFDTLHYEVTIDDPGAYTKPWSSELGPALGRRRGAAACTSVRTTGRERAGRLAQLELNGGRM